MNKCRYIRLTSIDINIASLWFRFTIIFLFILFIVEFFAHSKTHSQSFLFSSWRWSESFLFRQWRHKSIRSGLLYWLLRGSLFVRLLFSSPLFFLIYNGFLLFLFIQFFTTPLLFSFNFLSLL